MNNCQKKLQEYKTLHTTLSIKYLTTLIDDLVEKDNYGIRYIDYFPEERDELIRRLEL